MEKTYTKKFLIHIYEVDFRGRALPVTLLNYLQDAAGDHAALLGFSLFDLLKINKTWLLSRYHIRVQRYPRIGEEVIVRTWPSGAQRIFALRDSEMTDGSGKLVAAATSSWVLWDILAKQPDRLDERLRSEFVFEKRAIDDPFEPLPALAAPGTPDRELDFRVGMQDIDFNNHVTYDVYIQWALETVPEGMQRSCIPAEIEVSYRAEAFYGDDIISRLKKGDTDAGVGTTFLHAIYHKSRATELARLRTVWTKFR
jgi:medium-chain acyl-[acyl-carrier-protein] hydrolase